MKMTRLRAISVASTPLLLLACSSGESELGTKIQDVEVSCEELPQYYDGTTAQEVQNLDQSFHCTVPGWCAQAAWAYEPGAGLYWEDAWSKVGDCSDDPSSTGGSSSGGSASGGAPSSGGSASGGAPSSGGTGTGGDDPWPEGLNITGSSNLTLTDTGGIAHHHQSFDGTFFLENQTGSVFTPEQQTFFFVAPGGYAFGTPSFDVWWGAAESGTLNQAGPFGWGWSAPLSHLVARVDGQLNGAPSATVGTIPLLRSGYQAPDPVPYVKGEDLTIGVQGPVELVELAGGTRWIGIVGTVVDGTRSSDDLHAAVQGSVLDASGNSIVSLSTAAGWPGGTPESEIRGQHPIRRFLAWAVVPNGASPAGVSITASLDLDGEQESRTQTFDVKPAQPVHISPPLVGNYGYGNGPGRGYWHAHSGGSEARYGYDLCNGLSGDASVNENYNCYGDPIYAAADGTVVQVYDNSPENNGNLFDHASEPNNEITILHADGVYTRYAHMPPGSAMVEIGAQVSAGDQIAVVGNAGASSGPHLHFHAYRVDNTGRVRSVAVTIQSLKSTSGTPLSGVPRGAVNYITSLAQDPDPDPNGCGAPAWSGSTNYNGGEIVSNDGAEYQCKPWPYSGWCKQREPGVGQAWQDAWISLGACN